VLVGLSCTYAIGTLTPFPTEIPTYEFAWAVSVGDTFVLEVNGASHGFSTMYGIPSALVPALENHILVTIVTLPNCSISSEDEFLTLVESLKVDCAYQNGSELPEETVNALRPIISNNILPIGGWDFINWLFPSSMSEVEVPSNYIIESYLTSADSTYLSLRYVWSYANFLSYTYGSIYLSTGLPHLIKTGESDGDDYWFVELHEV
jgi:hypothetical protein